MKNMKSVAWMLAMVLMMGCMIFPAGAEGERIPPPEIAGKAGAFGKYTTFGAYEQDNNLDNGPEPIEWRVLEVKDGRALVVSVYALEYMPYHGAIAEDKSITWETWDLRAWLNGEFIATAFTEAERERIPVVTVTADRNPHNPLNAGKDTQDQIFLLSLTEVQRYLSSSGARKCKATDYAIAKVEERLGREIDIGIGYKPVDRENCAWWLRTPGEADGSASSVLPNGSKTWLMAGQTEKYVDYWENAVRPAMWIDLEP